MNENGDSTSGDPSQTRSRRAAIDGGAIVPGAASDRRRPVQETASSRSHPRRRPVDAREREPARPVEASLAPNAHQTLAP
jgi:hypothetical protein